MQISLLALVLGFIMDLLLGDPRWIYHPIRIIGNLIGFLEKNMNDGSGKTKRPGTVRTPRAKRSSRKMEQKVRRNPKGEKFWGIIMVLLVLILSTGIPLLILMAAHEIHPILRLAVETVMCWQLLAAKSLRDESMKVYEPLKQHDLEKSRKAVAMIVGRDTEELDEGGVTRAAVETVAENASDGVIAPMFYMAIGGASLGFFYKAINTMDSMVGYKNDRYRYFGWFAAKLDDVVNFIPARLAALFMVVAAFMTKMNGEHAWKIFLRDRKNHASPNSAQTEAVMAGALKIQLGGDAWYFGEHHKKPTIGDSIRPIKPTDIVRANILLYAASSVSLAVFTVIKCIVILVV